MPVDETVTINKSLFQLYRLAYFELEALRAHGVDNWDGYSDAISELYNPTEEDEDE